MKKLVCLIVLLPVLAFGGTYTMYPSVDTSLGGDSWALHNTNKATAINDNNTSTFIAGEAAEQEGIGFDDISSSIPDAETIDSIRVFTNSQCYGALCSKNLTYRLWASSGHFCNAAVVTISAPWQSHPSGGLTSPPNGASSCSGGWNEAYLDSLVVGFIPSSGGGDSIGIRECSVVVYTTAAGSSPARRRRMIPFISIKDDCGCGNPMERWVWMYDEKAIRN